MIKLTRNVTLKENSPLNTNAVVLAIIKTFGKDGLFTHGITQTLLRLTSRSTFNIERIDVISSPWGPDSSRIRGIVWNLTLNGFLERDIGEDGPVRITPKGEIWMKRTLLEGYQNDESALAWFLLVLSRLRKKSDTPEKEEIKHDKVARNSLQLQSV